MKYLFSLGAREAHKHLDKSYAMVYDFQLNLSRITNCDLSTEEMKIKLTDKLIEEMELILKELKNAHDWATALKE